MANFRGIHVYRPGSEQLRQRRSSQYRLHHLQFSPPSPKEQQQQQPNHYYQHNGGLLQYLHLPSGTRTSAVFLFTLRVASSLYRLRHHQFYHQTHPNTTIIIMVNFCDILRHLWRILTCSSTTAGVGGA